MGVGTIYIFQSRSLDIENKLLCTSPEMRQTVPCCEKDQKIGFFNYLSIVINWND